MKDFLAQRGFLGTAATLGGDLSQVMAMLFTVLFIIGWVQARKKLGNAHHWLVLGGMVAMLSFFTSYYLFRQLGVLAFEGRTGFGGSDFMYYRVFIPLLTFHIMLVICRPYHGGLHDRPRFSHTAVRRGQARIAPGPFKGPPRKTREGFWHQALPYCLYCMPSSGTRFGTDFSVPSD